MIMNDRIRTLVDALHIQCTERQTLEHRIGQMDYIFQGPEKRAANAQDGTATTPGGLPSALDRAPLTTVHRLLTPDLLVVPSSESNDGDEATDADNESISEMIDTFGMLAIQNERNAHLWVRLLRGFVFLWSQSQLALRRIKE